jgi:hypothetical protein
VCVQADTPPAEEAVAAQRPHRKLITDGAARKQAVPVGGRKQAVKARAKGAKQAVHAQPPPPVEEEEAAVVHEDDFDDVATGGEVPSGHAARRQEAEEEVVAAREEEAGTPPAPAPARHVRPRPQRDDAPPARGVYRFSARGIDGEMRALGEFAGQARHASARSLARSIEKGTAARTLTHALRTVSPP